MIQIWAGMIAGASERIEIGQREKFMVELPADSLAAFAS
jgi:hypothetical protein